MKRVAEFQLTKDAPDDEDDAKEPPKGIQKADPSALTGRPIRGLPKRALTPATTQATSTALTIESSNGTAKKSPEPASRFSGFGGFGNSSSSAFTFTPPVEQAKPNVTETPGATTAPLGKSAPSSQPLKAFSFSPLSTPTSSFTPPSTSEPQTKRDAAHKYCLSLRGLNVSFLEAVTQAVQTDPFVDIVEILEKYKTLRSSAQKEFDDSLAPRPNSGATPLSKNTPSMPTPPKSFFGFRKGTDTGATSESHTTGFTPKLDHSQNGPSFSPFTWSTKAGTSDKPSSFDAFQPFTSSKDSSSPGNQTPGHSTTPFGNPTTTADKAFQGEDTQQEKVTASSPFNSKASAPTVPLTPGLSSFLNPSKPSDIGDAKSNSSKSSPPSNPFGFGTGKPSSISNPFSFGKGSIGNPVGFAFGSPPATSSDVKASDAIEQSKPELTPSDDADSSLPKPSQDPSPAPSQGSVYDADGPGEEDEVTLHEVKAHAYKMASTGDKKCWISAGRGQLKLKGRVDIKRRILMRNSSTGQIILNFNLFPGFNMDVGDRMISFRVPGEDESAVVYRLRVPNEADAVNCQKAIQKEVDGLSPSHET